MKDMRHCSPPAVSPSQSSHSLQRETANQKEQHQEVQAVNKTNANINTPPAKIKLNN